MKWVVIWVSLLLIAVVVGLLIRARSATVAPAKVAVVAAEPMVSNRVIGVECPGMLSPVVDPGALAVDMAGLVYVGGSNEVAVLSADGKMLRRFPVLGEVTGLAVDEEGNVLAGLVDRVGVYDKTGRMEAEWRIPGTNAILTSLAVDEGVVYVADAGQHCVWRFDLQGKVLGVIRRAGVEFNIPSPYFDVAIGTGEGVWVVDPGRHEVVNYSPDGAVRMLWGRAGSGDAAFCGCCNPIHIVLLADGSFLTAEKGITRVKKISSSGELVGIVAGKESFVAGARITDLAVDGSSRVLVLDAAMKTIRVFEVSKTGRN